MKILVATYFSRSLELEGGKRIIDSLARAYVSLGHTVTVVAPVKRSPNYRVVDFLKKSRISVKGYVDTLKVEARKHDVVHILEPSPSTMIFSSICCNYNRRTFATILTSQFNLRDLLKDFNRQFLFHFMTKNRAWSYLWNYPCKKYFVATLFQKQQLMRCGIPKEKIMIMPYGLIPKDFLPLDKTNSRKELHLSGAPAVGYIGHFHHNKDVGTILQAAELVKPKFQLVIAWSGKGTDSKRILRLIQKSTVKTTIMGTVDVRKFMSAIDMIALPYPGSNVPYFPLVIMEAFAMGTPVITTEVGGIPELIKGNAILIKPKNPVELAKAIGKLINDKKLRHKISLREIAEFQNRLDMEKIAQRLINIFEIN